jgi:hypothetical protein
MMHEPPSLKAILLWLLAVMIVFGLICAMLHRAHARDLDGRYAQRDPELHKWFEGLRSGKGPCCSDADGTALSDVDREAKGGRYRVRLEGQWWDVPDEAVITEPNRAGRTMVWPVYLNGAAGKYLDGIRCFMPGPMT